MEHVFLSLSRVDATEDCISVLRLSIFLLFVVCLFFFLLILVVGAYSIKSS